MADCKVGTMFSTLLQLQTAIGMYEKEKLVTCISEVRGQSSHTGNGAQMQQIPPTDNWFMLKSCTAASTVAKMSNQLAMANDWLISKYSFL